MRKLRDKKTRERAKNLVTTAINSNKLHTPLHSVYLCLLSLQNAFASYLYNEDVLKLENKDFVEEIAFNKEMTRKLKTVKTQILKYSVSFKSVLDTLGKDVDFKMSSGIVEKEIQLDKRKVQIEDIPDKDYSFISFLTVFSYHIESKIQECYKYFADKKEISNLNRFLGRLYALRDEILEEVKC